MMLKSNLITKNSLVIMLWKANGTVQNKNEFEIFLHVNVVDVAIITETHLTYSKSFKISGYKIYTTENPDGTAQGGFMIIIKNYYQQYEHLSYRTDAFQIISANINTDMGYLTVAAMYCHPGFVIPPNQYDTIFSKLGNRFICGGDFNSKSVL